MDGTLIEAVTESKFKSRRKNYVIRAGGKETRPTGGARAGANERKTTKDGEKAAVKHHARAITCSMHQDKVKHEARGVISSLPPLLAILQACAIPRRAARTESKEVLHVVGEEIKCLGTLVIEDINTVPIYHVEHEGAN